MDVLTKHCTILYFGKVKNSTILAFLEKIIKAMLTGSKFGLNSAVYLLNLDDFLPVRCINLVNIRYDKYRKAGNYEQFLSAIRSGRQNSAYKA